MSKPPTRTTSYAGRMKAKISPAFQICIPQTVRVLLRLNVADYLRFVERDGKIYVEKADDE